MDSVREKVLGFLNELETGQPAELDEDGICTIGFDSGLTVTLSVPRDGSFFSLSAGLIEAPADASLPLLTEALRMNLRFSDTGGGSIGFNDQEELLVFRFWHPVDNCDGQMFARILANFVAACYKLHDRLQEIAQTMVRASLEKARDPLMCDSISHRA